jgi:DNA-binding transcriptional MerR regulator
MSEALLSIGEVINLLRDEFPDVSVSKIRFLESQGLIAPARSEGGYRMFGPRDLQRVRYILSLQRDQFLPLKVIKSKLTLWERGEDPEIERPPDRKQAPGGEPLHRSDLLRKSGLTEEQLRTLVTHGLLGEGSDDVFQAWTLPVAIEARRLLAMGLEARHLRTVRLAAQREGELVRQLMAAQIRARNQEARALARRNLSACVDALETVHHHLLFADLTDLLEP